MFALHVYNSVFDLLRFVFFLLLQVYGCVHVNVMKILMVVMQPEPKRS